MKRSEALDAVELLHSRKSSLPDPEPPPETSLLFFQRRRFLEIGLLVILAGAALVLRLWPLQIAHWWDEAAYLQNAEFLFFGKTNYTELDFRPPLLSVLFGLSFLLWHNVMAASIVVAALNTLGVLFLAAVARLLHGPAAGLIAGVFLGLSPFFAETGRTLMTDNPALSLLILSFFFVVSGSRKESLPRFLAAGVFLGAAGLMRFASLHSALPLLLLVWQGPRRRSRVAVWTAGLAVSFGPYLVWSHVHLGSWWAGLQKASGMVGDANESYAFYFLNLGELFSWAAMAGLALWLLVCVASSFVEFRRVSEGWNLLVRPLSRAPEFRQDFLLLFWLLWLLAYFTYVPHKELRYLAPAALPLFLLAAHGWSRALRICPGSRRIAASVVLAAAVAWHSAPAFTRFEESFLNTQLTDEVAASQFVESLPRRPDMVLYVNFNMPVFGYYTGLPIRTLEPADDSFFQEFPRNMPADGYVVLYKEARQPTPAWADGNLRFQRLREFLSLVAYEYKHF